MKPLKELTRHNIWSLETYSSARNEYNGAKASIFLDANENPFNSPNNRYPDPLQKDVKNKISIIKGIDTKNIFLGNGSDEPIDLVYRAFCNPGKDNVVAVEPTYGMYQVCADINDVEYRKVLLDENFQFKASDLLNSTDNNTKLIFICSPNNPTGNCFHRKEIETILKKFQGIVILDEAYSDFSNHKSFLSELDTYPNLIILQTFSKAWGCAAIRLGMAFASTEIIEILNKIKYPYNINRLTQDEALKMLEKHYLVKEWVESLKNERERLLKELSVLKCCKHIYPTDANFFLTRVSDAKTIYNHLVEKGIIVRNRTNVILCNNCLRITVGTRPENDALLNALHEY